MKNKNLLITGAATRVGKAIALHFAEKGWNIALHYFRSSSKAKELKKNYKIENIKRSQNIKNIIFKTLGFTYLNPHVYSDTVFILGNLSKNFLLQDKFYFALGASIASIIFFYSLGYMSSLFAKFIKKHNAWKYINFFIIVFMTILVVYIIYDIYNRVFSH